jgi:tetratricopeptide (TPR) repeat protein
LALAEVLGVIEYDVGNERRRKGRWADAQHAYERARKHFPDFAEAHASLGALAQLMGALDEAKGHYEAARRVNPNLPGLDRNLELLESERSAHPTQ